ncbi:Cu(I)-responsive transcriptional regulator [Billgrantia ethanolica]|uniref:Cu(I)-responsive transcriptional regulator n=1 Tax=Billgrantia ethanolica TaxID=2733486 RepID=A0ABS9A456_9GAMM|nr:Cu(I)-responsive transcriptional regulator [Halomonas ethanolica]MCE8003633.1 Cu(I)-responsive transcriptional regulator [Halomonas ethanolica]
MNIGEAAAASGISAKMIRYYESIELIMPVARTEAGYRIYREQDIHTLRFIRQARDLGFSMSQIQELVNLWHDRSRASRDVKRIAMAHVEELRHRANELNEMAQKLQHLAQHCHGDHRPDCPIIGGLSSTRHANPVSAAE